MISLYFIGPYKVPNKFSKNEVFPHMVIFSSFKIFLFICNTHIHTYTHICDFQKIKISLSIYRLGLGLYICTERKIFYFIILYLNVIYYSYINNIFYLYIDNIFLKFYIYIYMHVSMERERERETRARSPN